MLKANAALTQVNQSGGVGVYVHDEAVNPLDPLAVLVAFYPDDDIFWYPRRPPSLGETWCEGLERFQKMSQDELAREAMASAL